MSFTRSEVQSYVDDEADRPGAYTCKKFRISTDGSRDTDNDRTSESDWIIGSLNIIISDEAKEDLPRRSRLYDKSVERNDQGFNCNSG